MRHYFLDFCKTFAFFPTGNEFGKVKKNCRYPTQTSKKGLAKYQTAPHPTNYFKNEKRFISCCLITNFIIFVQMGLTSLQVDFKVEVPKEELEKTNFEHLALGSFRYSTN